MIHSRRRVITCLTLFALMLFLVYTLILAIPDVRGEESGISFSRGRVTPRSGESDNTFLFTVTVSSEYEPVEDIRIVINGRTHSMKEINHDDRNYSDGKDFYYRQEFDARAVVYFFRCGNTSTPATTLSVSEAENIEWHIDLALVMSLFLIPVVYAVVVFRRIERRTREVILVINKIGGRLKDTREAADKPGNDYNNSPKNIYKDHRQ